MKRSVRVFLLLAFSTSSRMRDTVDSEKGLVTRTRIRPEMLTQPEMISSPSAASRGRDSPVSAAVLSVARLDHDDVADLNLFGIDLFELAVPLNVGVIGADVHQGADGFAALAHRIALEQLAHLVKQHDRDGLFQLAHAQRTHRRHHHQEVLVEHLPVKDGFHGFLES